MNFNCKISSFYENVAQMGLEMVKLWCINLKQMKFDKRNANCAIKI